MANCLTFVCVLLALAAALAANVDVDLTAPIEPFPHYWKR
jgi:hypothetical protein